MASSSTPTPEEIEDLLLSCRYGDLEEVQAFLATYGIDQVAKARDDSGNTVLHMCCGNGHVDILNLLLPTLPISLLQTTNSAKSPPLHWAILNSHLPVVKVLVELPESKGGGLPLMRQTNASNRDALEEASWLGEGREEVSGWLEGFCARFEGEGDEGESGASAAGGVEGASGVTGDITESTTNEVVEDEDKEVEGVTEKTEKLEV